MGSATNNPYSKYTNNIATPAPKLSKNNSPGLVEELFRTMPCEGKAVNDRRRGTYWSNRDSQTKWNSPAKETNKTPFSPYKNGAVNEVARSDFLNNRSQTLENE